MSAATSVNDKPAPVEPGAQRLMKAAMITEYNTPFKVLDDIPVPVPGPGEVLVRITASSLCMTDVICMQGVGSSPLPYCGGHEPVGVVEQAGPGVRAFAPGDRVGFMPASRTCQGCSLCLAGDHRHCAGRVNVGLAGPYGGFSQYCVADVLSTVKIPDAIPDHEAAPLFCAGITAYAAVKKAARRKLENGSSNLINIVGCGGVGHLAIMYAKAMGLRVAAFDVAEDKLELARRCGADVVVNSATTPAAQVEGAVATIVVSAALRAYEFAIQITLTCGAVIAVGVPHDLLPCNVSELVLRELSLVGTYQGTKRELAEALQLAAQNGIKPVIERRHIKDINDGIEAMIAGKITGRLVYDMW